MSIFCRYFNFFGELRMRNLAKIEQYTPHNGKFMSIFFRTLLPYWLHRLYNWPIIVFNSLITILLALRDQWFVCWSMKKLTRSCPFCCHARRRSAPLWATCWWADRRCGPRSPGESPDQFFPILFWILINVPKLLTPPERALLLTKMSQSCSARLAF